MHLNLIGYNKIPQISGGFFLTFGRKITIIYLLENYQPKRSITMEVMKNIVIMFALCVPTIAQLPDAPKPSISFSHPTWQQWTSLSVRSLDAASTDYCNRNGAHEDNIPEVIAQHGAADEAYGIAVVAVEWWAIRKFVAPRHPRIARWLPLVDSAYDAPYAIRNFWQHGNKSSSVPGSTIVLPISKK
jgi:hypothetical protein